MGIQRVARGVRVATQQGYLIGRLRGTGQAKTVSVQDVAAALGATGQVAIPGSAPAAVIVAAGTGISVGYAGVTYTVTNTGVLSNIAGSGISVSGATGNVTIGNTGVLSVVAPAAGFTVSGATGNVTFTLANDLAALEGLPSTGIAVRSAANTWVQRSVDGTANRITLTNGDGVAGSPTVDISSSYVGQNTITTLGTIGTGTWQGTVIAGTYGGTGVNNGASTITIGGNVTHAGAFPTTITVSATTNSTLPAGTHTLAGLDVAQTWSANQQFNSGNFLLKGATSGTITLNAAATAGSNTLTLPAGTTDFSATGGTAQIVRQSSAGAALTVGTLADTELSGAAWTAYTPTFSPFAGAFTTASASGAWKQVGKTVFFTAVLTITTNGTASGFINVGLPTTTSSTAGLIYVFFGREVTSTGLALNGTSVASSSTFSLVVYDNTYPGGDGATLVVTGAYQTA